MKNQYDPVKSYVPSAAWRKPNTAPGTTTEEAAELRKQNDYIVYHVGYSVRGSETKELRPRVCALSGASPYSIKTLFHTHVFRVTITEISPYHIIKYYSEIRRCFGILPCILKVILFLGL